MFHITLRIVTTKGIEAIRMICGYAGDVSNMNDSLDILIQKCRFEPFFRQIGDSYLLKKFQNREFIFTV